MVAKAPLEATDHGLVPAGEGWFVLNAREARWFDREGRGVTAGLEGAGDFWQLGVTLVVLGPGEPMAMYHWETDQEDFLLLAGEGILVVEGEERPLRAWDFVHCPPRTRHVIVGAGGNGCTVFAVGSRSGPGSASTTRPGRRGRGWALLCAVGVLPYYRRTNPVMVRGAKHTIAEVLSETSS